ncbi:MAG: aminotransferase class IV [Flavobacteriales bacterium]|nr:aminotransferase class IV [Flavobacteriales bacterium]
MSEFYCYLNGETLPVKDAHIHISDLGLLRSYAVFDYFRTYNSKPYMLSDHLNRFRNSAADLRLPLNLSDEEIGALIQDLITKSEVEDAGIRMVLTGGYSADSMAVTEPNFMIIVEQLPVMPEGTYSKGVSLKTYEYLRDSPGIKSTQYLNAIKLQPLKEKYGVFDLLYYYDDAVLESPRNNFFIFKDSVLITAEDNVLKGVTRKMILHLAEGVFEIEERRITMEELRNADEAFISGTTRRIIPVVKIDDQPVGDGEVGECTKKLIEVFDAYISAL